MSDDADQLDPADAEARLRVLDSLPVDEHVAIYDALHRELRDQLAGGPDGLASVDGGAPPGAGSTDGPAAAAVSHGAEATDGQVAAETPNRAGAVDGQVAAAAPQRSDAARGAPQPGS